MDEPPTPSTCPRSPLTFTTRTPYSHTTTIHSSKGSPYPSYTSSTQAVTSLLRPGLFCLETPLAHPTTGMRYIIIVLSLPVLATKYLCFNTYTLYRAWQIHDTNRINNRRSYLWLCKLDGRSILIKKINTNQLGLILIITDQYQKVNVPLIRIDPLLISVRSITDKGSIDCIDWYWSKLIGIDQPPNLHRSIGQLLILLVLVILFILFICQALFVQQVLGCERCLYVAYCVIVEN